MPRLTSSTQTERRGRILDAAEICFARKGFHAATMQDICAGAGVSAGALYLYFPSKEALIAGIAERDRREIAAGFAAIGEADDLFAGLAALGRHFLVERPAHKAALMLEIGAESTRNPAVAALCREVDDLVRSAMARLFEAGKRRGQVAPDVDAEAAAALIGMLGDGVFWRRAVHPAFDPEQALAGVMAVIAHILDPEGVLDPDGGGKPLPAPVRSAAILAEAGATP